MVDNYAYTLRTERMGFIAVARTIIGYRALSVVSVALACEYGSTESLQYAAAGTFFVLFAVWCLLYARGLNRP